MSPGNLYRYFTGKEAIIAGIAERDRADAAQQIAAVGEAPDFFTALAGLARHHLVERPRDEVALCAEIMAESRRNPDIARIYQGIETEVKEQLVALLKSAAGRGEVASDLDFDSAAVVLMALADGISWRRAVDPHFSAEKALPLVLKVVHCALSAPVGASDER